MQRHAILTQGRSGSSYLRGVIGRHPQLATFGEVLGEWTPYYQAYLPSTATIDAYLAGFFEPGPRLSQLLEVSHKKSDEVRNVGIKEFFYNIERRGASDFFVRNADIAIVHLCRENLLHRYISLLVQRETGVSNRDDQPVPPEPRRIDTEKLVEGLQVLTRERDWERRFIDRVSHTHRIHTVIYEEYFCGDDSIERHNRALFEFLGVEPLWLRSNLKKLLPRRIAEMIANYEELQSRLAGGPYERYVTEQS